MHRRVCVADQTGVTETVTWRNLTHITADQLDRPVKETAIEWADGVSYEYDSGQSLADLLRQAERFPRDLDGWNALLLMVDAHIEFDNPRAASSGVTELKRIGDCSAHQRREEFAISLAPFATATFPGGEWTEAKFVGLSLIEDAPCAILTSTSRGRVPFKVEADFGTFAASTGLRRELNVRLQDGVLEDGVSVEWVCVADRWINPLYTIERTDPDLGFVIWERPIGAEAEASASAAEAALAVLFARFVVGACEAFKQAESRLGRVAERVRDLGE
jgi:hypothetical protein